MLADLWVEATANSLVLSPSPRRRKLCDSMKRKDRTEDDLQRLRVAWLSRAPGDRFRLGGGAFVGLPGPILRQALRLESQN